MKRRRRDIVIFTLSALDLLAMATGTFVLIVVLLLPYYRKSHEAHAAVQGVRVSTETMAAEIEALRAAAAAEQQAVAAARSEAEKLRQRTSDLSTRADRIKREARAIESESERQASQSSAVEAPISRPIIEALDLVFVVDSTASMTPVLRDLSLSIGGIVRVLERLVRSLRVGVVVYRDYDYRPDWVTRDLPLTPTATQARSIYEFISSLEPPRRGGKTPREAVFAGVEAALQMAFRSGARQTVVLVGDAAPHSREERVTIDMIRRFISADRERRVSALFVPTPSWQRFDSGDRAVFEEIARVGFGQFTTHSGQMMESVLLSVLDD